MVFSTRFQKLKKRYLCNETFDLLNEQVENEKVTSQWQRSDLWEDQKSSQQLYNQMETFFQKSK
jgi:hypothetical protein